MKFYVGVTDEGWFRFLRDRSFEEVNFWRPSSQLPFKALVEGEPFLFKLKKHAGHAIAGVGTFLHYASMTIPEAWSGFGEENGVADYPAFVRILGGYGGRRQEVEERRIGCVILGDLTFFKEEDWIAAPPDWSDSIVQGKTYQTSDAIGAVLWQEVMDRLADYSPVVNAVVENPGLVYGGSYLAKRRLGQGLFRVMTLENYRNTCCITGETTVPVIEAAHIRPVSRGGEHRLCNGLAMRADMHRLFDRGLISVDEDYRIRVSSRIKDMYHNGVVYYSHQGAELRCLPSALEARPHRDLLRWHYKEAFIA